MSLLTPPSASRPAVRSREAGSILVPALFLVLALGSLAAVNSLAKEGSARSLRAIDEVERLETLGDSALELAMSSLWDGYLRSQGGQPGSISSFQTYLDFVGIPASAGAGGQAFQTSLREGPDFEAAMDLAMPAANPEDAAAFAGATIHSLRVLREDRLDVTFLRFDIALGFQGAENITTTREMSKVFNITGEDFEGFNFALLANNINCIMCHAQIDNVQRYFNEDVRRFGTYDKVRVGALESLQIRPTKAGTQVAGTLYSRGPILDHHGNLISNLASTTLKSVDFNASGRITQQGDGSVIQTDMVPAPNNQTVGANLYPNYPTDPSQQVDGFMPSSFPPVIPDPNENRRVDPEEFATMLEQSNGQIEGGFKQFVAHGSSMSGSGLPTSDGFATVGNHVNGNLVLHGTQANPIRISGRVAVDGDVVITGYVVGDGEIIASGNTFVVGPVLYADALDQNGKRVYGRSTEGRMNRLALGAAGNIVVGDFEQRAPWLGSNALGFTERQLMTFNRAEWAKTQPTLPGANGVMVANPDYDPTHTPRYYAMEPGGDIHIWTGGRAYYDPNSRTWRGAETYSNWNQEGRTTVSPGDPLLANAVVTTMRPQSGWFSENQLRQMWRDGESVAPEARGLQIDGLLYTSNMAMWIASKYGHYQGYGMVNGSIVAADVGILLPGNGQTAEPGLVLNYDGRLRGALGVRNLDRVEINRAMRLY